MQRDLVEQGTAVRLVDADIDESNEVYEDGLAE